MSDATRCPLNRKRDYHAMRKPIPSHVPSFVAHPTEWRFMMCRTCGRAVYRRDAAEAFDAGIAIPFDAARPRA